MTTMAPLEKTKDITVNGVNLRITRLNAFDQQDVLDLVAAPVLAALSAYFSCPKGKGAMLEGVATLLKNLSATERHKVIFDYLLSDRSVRVVVNGAEMPLVGSDGAGGRTVMQQSLDDIMLLYQIASEVFVFNFDRFMASAASGIKEKLQKTL